MMSRVSAPAEEGRYRYIDGLRAVAVLAVVAWHATNANDAHFPSWAECGSRGVDLFFVISGFCLGLPFLRAWRCRGTFRLGYAEYGRFLLRRFSRIAPPFYAVILLFAMLAATPFGLPNADHQDTSSSHVIRDIFANLAFLTAKQPLLNASFWTLGIEARWYLLCPLLIALYVRSALVFSTLGMLMYGLYFLSPYGIADEGTLPCFMAGIVAADVILLERPWRRYAWICASAFLIAAVVEQSRTPAADLGDPFWSAACFFLVVAGSHGFLSRLFELRPLLLIGGASYSIYLVHEPFVEWFVRGGVGRPIAGACALAIGLAAYRFIEKPMAAQAFRGAIERAIATTLGSLRAFRVEPESNYGGERP
jgi:peptidoglycan/LPS O-acetylase OafA/YrhL